MAAESGRLTSALALIGPLLCGFLALVLTMAPFGAAFGAVHGPNWLLWALVIWAGRRPSLAPMGLVFAFGFLHDLLLDGPVGAGLLAFLVVVETVRGAADRRQSYSLGSEWTRLSLASTPFEASAPALLALSLSPLPLFEAVLWRLGVTIGLYPVFAWVVQKIFRVRSDDGRFSHLG